MTAATIDDERRLRCKNGGKGLGREGGGSAKDKRHFQRAKRVAKTKSEVRSSELDDVSEFNDDFHHDVNDVFELERVLELIFLL